jgi:hypothetical protein
VSGSPSLQVELQPLSGGSASGAPLSPSVALSQCDAAVALYGAFSFTACRVATVSVVPSALGGLRQFRLTHLHPTLLGTRTEANGTYTDCDAAVGDVGHADVDLHRQQRRDAAADGPV